MKLKLYLSMFILLNLLFAMPLCASAAISDTQSKSENLIPGNGAQIKEIAEYTFDENGNVVNTEIITDENDIREYIRKEKLQSSNQKAAISTDQNISPLMVGDKKVTKDWTSSWKQHLRTATGGPGGTINASVGETFSTTLTLNCSVSNSIITAGIGKQITNSVTVSQGYSHNITAGKYGHVNVGVNWNKISFTVYQKNILNNWVELGSGSYSFPVGAVFIYYED